MIVIMMAPLLAFIILTIYIFIIMIVMIAMSMMIIMIAKIINTWIDDFGRQGAKLGLVRG